MPDLTTNYKFKKPKANEYIKPDDFNYNFDKLDAELKSLGAGIPAAMKHQQAELTLATDAWQNGAQIVLVDGLRQEDTVIISPTPTFLEAYAKAGIYCSAQSTGALTFACRSAPSADITVNVVILGGGQ